MTLQDIEAIPRDYLNPKDVAALLNMDPYTINIQAHDDPDMLGFPVIVTGSRIRIPKAGFLHFMRYGKISAEPPAAWLEKLKAECLRLNEHT